MKILFQLQDNDIIGLDKKADQHTWEEIVGNLNYDSENTSKTD